ncbi:MAG: hypothetical protein ABI811_10885 [Acidobacteriota bacterium]
MAVLVPVIGGTSFAAETHVVSPTEMRQAAVSATQTRQQNVEAVNSFLSSPKAQQVIESSAMNMTQVKAAVAALDDQDLAKLAAQSAQAQNDFAAGRISDRDLLWIVVGIAVLVLIIIAVR